MLEAKRIGYRFDTAGPWLLEQLNLTVSPGEVVGLFGPSGAGKTTFAQIIAGNIQPDKGIVKVDGNSIPVKGACPVQLVWQHPEAAVNPKWRIKSVLQESGNPDQTLLHLLGIKKEWMRRWPSELSGGELQRVCIARAFGSAPRYIIADEMTAMLDAVTQAEIWQIILHLAEQRDIGVLAISHNKPLLNKISNRVIDFNLIV